MADVQASTLSPIPQPSKKAITLLRVSTDAQAGDERASIPAQKDICRRIAQQHNLEIIYTIEMVDVSGTAVLYAPEMKRLLQLIQRPDVHGVIAREFSRLMRPENYGDFAILQAFAESHTLLYLPDGPIDFASKTGRLMGTIRAAIAGLERSEILERVSSAKEQMRREGRWPNSDHLLPYGVGYDRKTGAWYYKPEAERVREIFCRFLAGDQNYDRLSAVLGVSRGSAKNILTNPIYTGWMLYHEKRDPSPKAKRLGKDGRQGNCPKVAREREEIIRVHVIKDGLVSQSDFDRVHLLIREKADRGLRMRTKVGGFTYNGFLWCAECGARFHTHRNQRDNFYYLCSNKKRKDDATGQPLCDTSFLNRDMLEPKLDHLFGDYLVNPGFLQKVCDRQLTAFKSDGSELRRQRLLDEISNLRGKRQRIADLYVDGDISRDERIARISKVDSQLAHAEEMLSLVAPSCSLDPANLAAVFAPFAEWAYLDRISKRQLLASINPQLKVWDNYEVQGLSIDSNMGSRWRMGPCASPALPCR